MDIEKYRIREKKHSSWIVLIPLYKELYPELFSEQYVNKFKSLCSDNELISAISNDISYDDIFVFQGKKCLEKGDLLILISSSGNSKNLKKILKYANSIKVKSIGFCGFNGGYLKNNCSVVIHSKINNYGISEDINHILMHLIMHYIKLKNLKKNVNNKKIIL